MPWSKRKGGKGWQVLNADTEEVKGEHGTEAEADTQLAALYANADPAAEKADETLGPVPAEEPAPDPAAQDTPSDELGISDELTACKTELPVPPAPVSKAAPSDTFNMFVPITKIDAEQRTVWGWGAKEEPDQTDEIMDYETSKPLFMDWSAGAQKRSGGKSMGNVRSMHQPNAAGKLVAFDPNDANKGFWMGAKVVDDAEWRKVQEGVYTGFSVGGSYVRRWPDRSQPGLIRYTAKPTEMSLVDSPAIPSATFQMVKGAGISVRNFTGGDGTHKLLIDPVLEKQIPGVPSAPEPTSTMNLSGDYPPAINVERMPEASTTLELSPGQKMSVPDQATLAAHAVSAKELTAAMNDLLGKLKPLVKAAVAEALADLQKVETTSVPPARMIRVIRPKSVQVRNKEN